MADSSRKVSPMAIKMLKPRLTAINVNRVKVLDTKAGATQRIRGDTWMLIRRRILLRDGYQCCDCGRVHASNQIDHDTPLEQGGSNDDGNNDGNNDGSSKDDDNNNRKDGNNSSNGNNRDDDGSICSGNRCNGILILILIVDIISPSVSS